MGAAVAVILIKERHVAEAFEQVRATAPERAISAQEANVDEGGIGWRRLRSRAIIREAAPGRFYLDVEGWQATRRMRRTRVMLVLAIGLTVFVAMLIAGLFAARRAAQ